MVQLVSERAGWSLLTIVRRGKSGLHRVGWSVTPTGRKARESATESKPPWRLEPPSKRAAAVRVKRCGKSAPAAGATRLARQTPPGARPSRASALHYCGARVDPARLGARVGCSRRRAIGVLEKWPSRVRPYGRREQNPAYRLGPRPIIYFLTACLSRDQIWSRKRPAARP